MTRTSLGALGLLLVLTLANTLAFVDRQVISLLVDPIRATIGASDIEMGLLQGLAFALLFAVFGLPAGRLVDTQNRKIILAGGVIVWSVATIACGMMGSFAGLFIARVFVGVGEATLAPAAYSMIADRFDKRALGRALSVYQSGIYLGSGIAFIGGGELYRRAQISGTFDSPLLGELNAWQQVFVAVGLPGFIAVALIALIKDPPRKSRAAPPALSEVFGYVRKHLTAYGWLTLGMAAFGSLGYGLNAWAPAAAERTFDLTPAIVGRGLGIAVLIGSLTGIITGGLLADYLSAKRGGYMRLVLLMIAGILITPIALFAANTPSAALALAATGVLFFLAAMPFSAGVAALQAITPSAMRGQISALYYATALVLAIIVGPALPPIVSTVFLSGEQSIGMALALTMAGLGLFGVLCLGFAIPGYRLASDDVDGMEMPLQPALSGE
ncbi:MAG: MFS transporter [Hyphomonadaceae bacterium]|nr:MFS transporter [Hyphomonadaceae bacterium]